MSDKSMDSRVKDKFSGYPKDVAAALMVIRTLIFKLAEQEAIGPVEESLKWGEPSYSSKIGSPIRIDWKEKSPDQYCVYFHCQSKLVDTFREVYGDLFCYEGNRALIFKRGGPVPKHALQHCLTMALRYHQIKHLPLLGS